MQHLEGSGAPVLYIGRKVLKDLFYMNLQYTSYVQFPEVASSFLVLQIKFGLHFLWF